MARARLRRRWFGLLAIGLLAGVVGGLSTGAVAGERRTVTVAPRLIDATLKAQSAQIDMVSGATYTSNGYVQSLQSALDAAGLPTIELPTRSTPMTDVTTTTTDTGTDTAAGPASAATTTAAGAGVAEGCRRGRVMRKTALPPAPPRMDSDPLWLSATPRTIDRPSPVPAPFPSPAAALRVMPRSRRLRFRLRSPCWSSRLRRRHPKIRW